MVRVLIYKQNTSFLFSSVKQKVPNMQSQVDFNSPILFSVLSFVLSGGLSELLHVKCLVMF